MAKISLQQAGGVNVVAFLDMIAHSEGTFGRGDDGYNILVGGTFFTGYADHPRRFIWLPALKVRSSAAGRYQLLSRTWDDLRAKYDLLDFSPVNQDLACIGLIKEAAAFELVRAGNFTQAVTACSHIWASFPGAGYGQHEWPLNVLQGWYAQAGGIYEPTPLIDDGPTAEAAR